VNGRNLLDDSTLIQKSLFEAAEGILYKNVVRVYMNRASAQVCWSSRTLAYIAD